MPAATRSFGLAGLFVVAACSPVDAGGDPRPEGPAVNAPATPFVLVTQSATDAYRIRAADSAPRRWDGARPAWAEGLTPVEAFTSTERVAEGPNGSLPKDWGLPSPLGAAIEARGRALAAEAEEGRRTPYRATLRHSLGPRGAERVQLVETLDIDRRTTLDFLVDLGTGRFTEVPLEIPIQTGAGVSARLTNELCDLDGDGVLELSSQCSFHHGTVTNVLERTWWRVDEDLSLQPVLALAVDNGETRPAADVAGRSVRRSLQRNAAGELVVQIEMAALDSGAPFEEFGCLRLGMDSRGVWTVEDEWCATGDGAWEYQLGLGLSDR